jgi:RNA polymerase sigma factor (sigma-70 family)
MKADRTWTIDSLREGDPTAWDHLGTEAIPFILARAGRQTADTALAEDAVQDGLYRAFRARRQLRARSRPDCFAWLGTICDRELARLGRRSRRFQSVDQDPVAEPVDIDEDQRLGQVHQAFRQLGQRDQDIIRLRLMEGRDYEVVAQTLHISTAAARVRLHRSVGRLRRQLTAQGVSIGSIALLALLPQLPGNSLSVIGAGSSAALAAGAGSVGMFVSGFSCCAMLVVAVGYGLSAEGDAPVPVPPPKVESDEGYDEADATEVRLYNVSDLQPATNFPLPDPDPAKRLPEPPPPKPLDFNGLALAIPGIAKSAALGDEGGTYTVQGTAAGHAELMRLLSELREKVAAAPQVHVRCHFYPADADLTADWQKAGDQDSALLPPGDLPGNPLTTPSLTMFGGQQANAMFVEQMDQDTDWKDSRLLGAGVGIRATPSTDRRYHTLEVNAFRSGKDASGELAVARVSQTVTLPAGSRLALRSNTAGEPDLRFILVLEPSLVEELTYESDTP